MTDDKVSEICKALSDANRLRIIKMLTDGELCACKILEALNITQPTLSHHMKILSEIGLVSSRKEGKWTYYSISCCMFKEFKAYFEQITCYKDRLKGISCACGESEIYHLEENCGCLELDSDMGKYDCDCGDR